MLEKIKVSDIIELKTARGVESSILNLWEQKQGDLIKVKTVSGNTYFFEVVDPDDCLVISYRLDARPMAPRTGCLGIGQIESKIIVGNQLSFFYRNIDDREPNRLSATTTSDVSGISVHKFP
jgi:hypothetical protein